MGSAVPTGLIVFICTYPGSELPGYCRTSLQDETPYFFKDINTHRRLLKTAN